MRKKIFLLSTVFALSIVNGLSASEMEGTFDNALIEEQKSCVSIAAEIAGGNSELFKAAYVGCIEGRL